MMSTFPINLYFRLGPQALNLSQEKKVRLDISIAFRRPHYRCHLCQLWPVLSKGVLSRCGRHEPQAKKGWTIAMSSTGLSSRCGRHELQAKKGWTIAMSSTWTVLSQWPTRATGKEVMDNHLVLHFDCPLAVADTSHRQRSDGRSPCPPL